jgi:hypothetical protein
MRWIIVQDTSKVKINMNNIFCEPITGAQNVRIKPAASPPILEPV